MSISPRFADAAATAPGPIRTAAIAAWLQGLYARAADVPILVGGAAVELYTGGAYSTGDFDFVGEVPAAIADRLTGEGFSRRRRHWVHLVERLYIEFPGSYLEAGEQEATIVVAQWRVRVLGLEDLLVDRLSAWQFWRSHVDGVNAYMLRTGQRERVDGARLANRATLRGVDEAHDALETFLRKLGARQPDSGEIERWARENP